MPENEIESFADANTRESALCERLGQNKLRCFACGHRCLIPEGKRGICLVRYNKGGKLCVPHGYVSALHADPIEKKPFYHALPGETALTFGMLGCDFHCPYCQNWDISQFIRDRGVNVYPVKITADEILQAAVGAGASFMVSSYNEPLITAEWAMEIFGLAMKHKLKTAFVSNGYATPEVLRYIRPFTECFKVDLKGMRQENYRELGGKVSVVLDTIKQLVEMKFWVEIVTLLVPGFNDSEEELKAMADFLASTSPDIPWHISAFHGDYKWADRANTSKAMLLRACGIGEDAGLKFIAHVRNEIVFQLSKTFLHTQLVR